MLFQYETDRLVLRICRTDEAKTVLDFYKNDKYLFEKYEPDRMPNFYTVSYQKKILKWEHSLLLKLEAVRFYVFLKDDPNTIIGTICYHRIEKSIYQSCEVGYKFASKYQHNGYAQEALRLLNDVMFNELNLHRIEAKVMPKNTASINLLEKLGFYREGLNRKCILLHNKWEDHYLYSLINPLEDF
ncbi:GNAT family N-acetyltransferase [Lachnobacterium bovis]|uniref:Ribosomal-protein-alanine N-acetyltransferase n=1 Tax=Lachnobacterium bovis TaxID=140626 RepID=A0A1H9UQA9_9FIRM|nr:GNAT family protein [Lachnobacterium bovis]SES11710.1 ribosomal-protein-alanine N-acetyltransferase [Lachnobacterium bovis]